jgi:hypothetical protein
MAGSERNFIKVSKNEGSMGFVLFLFWVGALVYFVQKSEGFGGFLLAILQSIVWPAILIYKVFEMIAL